MVKAGTSLFKDQRGDKFRFTHDETNPPLRFVYDADRCTPMSSSDGQLLSGNMEDIYIRYSPYGTWKLQVVGGSRLQLDAVTAVRFEFTLQGKPGRFAGAGYLVVMYATSCVSRLLAGLHRTSRVLQRRYSTHGRSWSRGLRRRQRIGTRSASAPATASSSTTTGAARRRATAVRNIS